jgi:hypothetical protein
MTYPIECSDEYGIEGVKDAAALGEWLRLWLLDPDSKSCTIEKVANPNRVFCPSNYFLAPFAQRPKSNENNHSQDQCS